jgi:hypothetical protein
VSIVFVLAGEKSLRHGHFYRQKKYRQDNKRIYHNQLLIQTCGLPLASIDLTVWRGWSIAQNKIPSAVPSGRSACPR